MISVCFQGKPFNIHFNPSLYPKYWFQRSWRWLVLSDLKYLLELTPKRCPVHPRLECISRKERDTQNNRQTWLWSTKWSRANASRVFSREHTGHRKHPLPTTQATQEMILCTEITRCLISKSDWLHSLQPKMEKLYTVRKKKKTNTETKPKKTCSWLWHRSWALFWKIQT